MGDNKKAVIQTLLYSNLFHFPLTKDELYYYCQSDHFLSQREFDQTLASLKKEIVFRDKFYCLVGCEDTIEERKKRSVISSKKLEETCPLIKILSVIPSVLFIGVSGSVAVGNATKEDDIDLFVITQNNSLYTTRLLLLFLLEITGKRRHRTEHKPQDKLCLNMLVDISGMAFPTAYHDLYTAREIAQIYPLFERNGYYQEFLIQNNWTKKFLPHALGQKHHFTHKKKISTFFLSVLEPLTKYFERQLIKRHQTNERAENHLLMLHPRDVKKSILQNFQKSLEQYNKYY